MKTIKYDLSVNLQVVRPAAAAGFKHFTRETLFRRILFVVLLSAAAVAAHAQSTAFTYQGRLAANGAPYTGFAEMQFALFTAPTGGVAVAASTPTIASVNVSGGLFATSLDFGAAAFPGADRWLEVQVRTNAGAFSTLTPRQPLAPTPYAVYARTAGTAQGPWVASGNDLTYTAGKVGIGTTTPSTSLHIANAAEPIIILQDTGPAETQSGFIEFWGASGAASVGFGMPGSPDFSVVNARSGGNIVLLPGPGGNVGIGTATPAAKLEVHGTVRLGATGQLFAPGGEENLRIIRGTVDGNATILAGQDSFTVTRFHEGDYVIVFSTPFQSAPTVTATVDDEFDEFVGVDFYLASVFSPSTSSVRVRTRVHSDVIDTGPHDRKFHFIAVGPR